MPKIKSAAKSRDQINRQIASEIVTVFKHLQGGSSTQRLTEAKNIVGDLLRTKSSDIDKINNKEARSVLLRQAVGLIDVTTGIQKTYPSTGSNSEPSKGPGDGAKSNPRSRYNYQDCVNRKIASGMPADESALECNQELGGKDTEPYTNSNTTQNAQTNGRDQAMKDCLDSGQSQAQCEEEMNELYPSAKVKKSMTAIHNPQRTKQASVRDVGGSWAICADAVEPDAKITLDSGIRNASAIPNTWYPESISDMMARKAELRMNKSETTNRLLNAKKKDEVPDWAICAGFNGF